MANDDTPAVALETPSGVIYALVETFPLDGGPAKEVLALQAEAGGPAERLALDSDQVKRLRQRYPDLDAHLSPPTPGLRQRYPDLDAHLSPPTPGAWSAPA